MLVAVIITATLTTSAQNSDENLKAVSGLTTDVNFTPFNGESMITLDALNFRYFLSPAVAIRLGVHLDIYSDKFDNEESGDESVVAKSSTILIGVHPGIERHFEGTNRLSPYVGGELIIDKFFAKASAEMGDNTYEIKGATDNNEPDFENRAFLDLGLGAFAGADYYFSKNIYLGAEFGIALAYRSFGEVEETLNKESEVISPGKQHEMTFGQNAKAALKLGWKF